MKHGYWKCRKSSSFLLGIHGHLGSVSNLHHTPHLFWCWKDLVQRPTWIHFISSVPGAGSGSKWVHVHWVNGWEVRAITTPCLSPTSPLHCWYCTFYLESLSLSLPILFSFHSAICTWSLIGLTSHLKHICHSFFFVCLPHSRTYSLKSVNT